MDVKLLTYVPDIILVLAPFFNLRVSHFGARREKNNVFIRKPFLYGYFLDSRRGQCRWRIRFNFFSISTKSSALFALICGARQTAVKNLLRSRMKCQRKRLIISLFLAFCCRCSSGFRLVPTSFRRAYFGRKPSYNYDSSQRSFLMMTRKKGGTKRKVRGTSPRSISNNIENDADQIHFNSTLLHDWVSHTDESFHNFTDEEATKIRRALLTWYRENRRKLPWRGDAPPYDGSTAGTATKSNGGTIKQKKIHDKKQQPIITSFFAANNNTVTKKKVKKAKTGALSDQQNNLYGVENQLPLPVTGYGVWVSEIMLQQTRVEAVIPYYLKWMERFPTVHDLAEASEEDVNAHWAGLGFYRRARLLHKGAKLVVNKYNGQLPKTVEGLLEIDGIGRYTASAVASIAFDVCVPVVDGNVCRVLARLKGIANNIKSPILKDDLGWKLAEQIVTAGDGTNAGEVNQAIMELGATYCAPTGSGTDERDPLKGFYMSTRLGQVFAEASSKSTDLMLTLDDFLPKSEDASKCCRLCELGGVSSVLEDLSNKIDSLEQSPIVVSEAAAAGHAVFPRPPPKKTKREEIFAVAAICLKKDQCLSNKEDRWLLVKRPKGGLLAGQWEFPAVCMWTSGDNKGKKEKAHLQKSKKGKGAATIDVPVIDANKRMVTLDSYLEQLSVDENGSQVHGGFDQCTRTNIASSPLEHIFSHVRHTMWVEYGYLMFDPVTNQGDIVGNWVTSNGQEVRWMSAADMKSVGITSGVKKILKSVQSNSSHNVHE